MTDPASPATTTTLFRPDPEDVVARARAIAWPVAAAGAVMLLVFWMVVGSEVALADLSIRRPAFRPGFEARAGFGPPVLLRGELWPGHGLMAVAAALAPLALAMLLVPSWHWRRRLLRLMMLLAVAIPAVWLVVTILLVGIREHEVVWPTLLLIGEVAIGLTLAAGLALQAVCRPDPLMRRLMVATAAILLGGILVGAQPWEPGGLTGWFHAIGPVLRVAAALAMLAALVAVGTAQPWAQRQPGVAGRLAAAGAVGIAIAGLLKLGVYVSVHVDTWPLFRASWGSQTDMARHLLQSMLWLGSLLALAMAALLDGFARRLARHYARDQQQSFAAAPVDKPRSG